MHHRPCGFVLAALISAAFALYPGVGTAKGPVDRITISGATLQAPVVLTSPEADVFDPWGRRFIDWSTEAVTAPELGNGVLTVSFAQATQAGAMRDIFTVLYLPGSTGERGYIYVPGPGDSHYRRNIGTVMGATSTDAWNPEGRWQYASAQWDDAVAGPLSGAAQPDDEQRFASPGEHARSWWVGGGLLVAILATASILMVRRRSLA